MEHNEIRATFNSDCDDATRLLRELSARWPHRGKAADMIRDLFDAMALTVQKTKVMAHAGQPTGRLIEARALVRKICSRASVIVSKFEGREATAGEL